MTSIRRFVLCAAAVASVVTPLGAQVHGTIVGTVRAVDGSPLGYTGVAILSQARDRLTTEQGTFRFELLPPGALRVRFRRVGFSPVDTQVVLRAGDTLQLAVSMQRLAIRLDAMKITAYCLSADSLAVAEESRDLNLILDQIRVSASQFRTLVNIYPFTKTMESTVVERMKDGNFETGRQVRFDIDVSDDANYERGRVFRRLAGRDRVVIPSLLDFADKEFLLNHCFSYGGDIVVDTNRFIKLQFAPIPGLKDPDIEGTATLRASDFGLVAVEMRTTGIPKGQANDIKSFRVVTHFLEVFPGIPVASTVESFIAPGPRVQKREPNLASRGELQRLEKIRWIKGPP